jgi:hypothetical protein
VTNRKHNKGDEDSGISSAFQWVSSGVPDGIETITLELFNDKKSEEPAGMEDTIICHHNVTFAFQMTLEHCEVVAVAA